MRRTRKVAGFISDVGLPGCLTTAVRLDLGNRSVISYEKWHLKKCDILISEQSKM